MRVNLRLFSISCKNDYGIEDYVAATTIEPVVAGYAFDRAPDLTDMAVRGRLSGSAIKAFIRIAERWRLTESQARGLLVR